MAGDLTAADVPVPDSHSDDEALEAWPSFQEAEAKAEQERLETEAAAKAAQERFTKKVAAQAEQEAEAKAEQTQSLTSASRAPQEKEEEDMAHRVTGVLDPFVENLAQFNGNGDLTAKIAKSYVILDEDGSGG